MTQNQASVCATFQVCIDALYAVLTNVCTFLFVGRFFFHKIIFSNFAIVLPLWLPWISDIETF